MKQRHLGFIFVVFTFFISSVFASTNSELYTVWQHTPITVLLPLNKTKTIKFVNPVVVGVPQDLKDKLSIDNQAGSIGFTALTSFKPTRIEVKDNTTHNVMILTLSTNAQASTASVSILYHQPAKESSDASRGWLKAPSALTGEISYVTLTRFAEQALYAPKRLQRDPYSIQLVTSYLTPNGGIKPGNVFHDLFYDDSTVNIPWASWRGGEHYVTAVLVRNRLSTSLNLMKNLPLLCGHDNGVFKAVTFFPFWKLTKAGTKNDTTVAFLVSVSPFKQAVTQCEGGANE